MYSHYICVYIWIYLGGDQDPSSPAGHGRRPSLNGIHGPGSVLPASTKQISRNPSSNSVPLIQTS